MRLSATTVPALLCSLAIASCGGGQSKPSGEAPARTGGATSTQPTTPYAKTKARPAVCAPSQLSLRTVSTQGATGHVEATFAFRNSSGSRCRLFGYPGARMLSRTGRALRTIVKRGGGFFPESRRPPRGVILAPGASARFGLGWSNNNEYGGSPATCPRADRLEVTPPNAYSTLGISVRKLYFAPCGGKLIASPVYR